MISIKKHQKSPQDLRLAGFRLLRSTLESPLKILVELATALVSELMYLQEPPEIVRERTLDRAAAGICEALSVHLASGRDIHYAQDDRGILTIIAFRPDIASREDNRVKYTPGQSQIFM